MLSHQVLRAEAQGGGGAGGHFVPVWSGQQFETCRSCLFHNGTESRGPLFSRQTQLTRFLCPHQYCYLHSVSIPGPYNHKMLIAPINSQSVCALVCSPGALKVRVKMNCFFILLQKKDALPRQNHSVGSEVQKRPSFLYRYYRSQWGAANGFEILWSDLSF